jgi:CheY-like chemotaxis protein/HPt (histidine-containing phosphotransfer) domain-containing protein
MSGKAASEVVEQLRSEFLDEVIETIQRFEVAFDAAGHGRGALPPLILECRRAAFSFRGQAANLSLHRLAAVAHRLEEYLSQVPAVPPPRLWDDLNAYFELIQTLTAGRGEAEVAEPARLVRSLPPRLGFELADIEIRAVEVLLVMPHGTQTRYVERELQQCGYRVSVMPDSLQAFAAVVQTRPDLVIISAMMPELDGIDLALALSAMTSTRNIPLAVITSLDRDDEALQLLPRRIPVLFKGPSFGDDLFRALDDLFLI